MTVIKKTVLIVGDIVLLYLSLAATLFIRYGGVLFPKTFNDHLVPFSLIFVLWIVILYLADLYRVRSLRSKGTIASTLFVALIVAGALSTIVFYLFGEFFELTPKTNLLLFGIVFFLLDYRWRSLARSWFVSGAQNVVVLGDGSRVEELMRYLAQNPHAGYRIAARLTAVTPAALAELTRTVLASNATSVILPPNASKDFSVLSALYRLLPLEVTLVSFSDFYEIIFEKEPLDELDEAWFIQNVSTRQPFYDSVKRVADLLLAGALILLFAPFSIIIVLLIAITSRGSIIYRQERVGKNGKPFTLLKFRTMRDGGEGALWTEPNDQRVTPFGRFLRFSHLDEIPQFVNVLRGDISFIGPRPERKELVLRYANLPYYEMRHIVKPGLTGWAQINYRPSASLEEAYEKLRYDIYYIKNRSLILDILIVLRTVKYFFLSHESHVTPRKA